jgi:hypothetical protein
MQKLAFEELEKVLVSEPTFNQKWTLYYMFLYIINLSIIFNNIDFLRWKIVSTQYFKNLFTHKI